VIDDETVWFAGSKGRYGYTEDGGKTWFQDSIFYENQPVHFRSIAATDEAIFLLTIASPALLFKTIDKGKNWKIVYQENDSLTFYDSMKFFDAKNGIAMGDPTDGCLSVILTNDGGNTWEKVSCENLPPVADGEAAFAASNTNISIVDNHVWIASGGKKARVFYSSDKGKTWAVYETPIMKGGQMTGIFSCHFYDKNNGIVFGGDWESQKENTKNKATTTDGGKTWQLVSDGQNPGYRSCVQYVPNTNGKSLVAVGIPGMDYSNDRGNTWINLNNTSFYTIRFSKSGKMAWLAGDGKIGFFQL
jgi:photosystem II stability/assembly factor-like uncharacterized protein